jgi:putative transposase
MTEIVADMGSLEKTIKKSASPEEAERAAIRELVVAARARGEDLTAPDGLLKTLRRSRQWPHLLKQERIERTGSQERRSRSTSESATRRAAPATPSGTGAGGFGYPRGERSEGRWARPPRMASMVMPSFAA